MANEIFRDRDYIQDKKGDIYQVIGSFHKKKTVFALQKYKKINPKGSKRSKRSKKSKKSKRSKRSKKSEKSKKYYKNLIKQQDPISKFKNHKFRFWIQHETGDKYIRILPNYSSISASNNIKNHPYSVFSKIFQMNMIEVPKSEIKIHWEPQKRFRNMLLKLEKGSFEVKSKLSKLEREAVEVGLCLKEKFSIDVSNIGITGSILWKSHHEQSDIDLIIYGWKNTAKIIRSNKKISSEKKGLRSYMKIEIYPIAQKMALKTGKSMEECFEYIFKKNYLFFFNDRKVSITFVPSISDLIYSPLYTLNSKFYSISPLTIHATILSDEWGYFYPGIFEIKFDKIVSDSDFKKKIDFKPKYITRLMVYEHEMVGYYKKGDKIEIRGLLQKCINVPSFKSLEIIPNTLQIIVGGKETFGNEYIACLTE